MNPYGLHPDDVRPALNVTWNFFLAAIPIAMAFWIDRIVRLRATSPRPPSVALIVFLVAVWCIFLPNTCYLLTEWRHYISAVQGIDLENLRLNTNRQETVLRTLIITCFYVCYSGSGLIAFFLAVWPIDRLLRDRIGSRARMVRAGLFAGCAFGVYLGLVYRFNTWDLFRPHRLHAILRLTRHAITNPGVVALAIGFTVILWLIYEAFEVYMRGLACGPTTDEPAPNLK